MALFWCINNAVVSDFRILISVKYAQSQSRCKQMQVLCSFAENVEITREKKRVHSSLRTHMLHSLNFNKLLPCRGSQKRRGKRSWAPCQPNEQFPTRASPLSGRPLFTCWLCGCVLRLQTCVFARAYPPVSWLLLRVTNSIKRWHLLLLRGKFNCGGGCGVQAAGRALQFRM